MSDHPSSHLSTGNEVSRRDFLKATAVTIASPSIVASTTTVARANR